jgi:hypothetical protein
MKCTINYSFYIYIVQNERKNEHRVRVGLRVNVRTQALCARKLRRVSPGASRLRFFILGSLLPAPNSPLLCHDA